MAKKLEGPDIIINPVNKLYMDKVEHAASPWRKVCDIFKYNKIEDGATILFVTEFGYMFVKTIPLRVSDCIIAIAKARSVVKFAIIYPEIGEE